MKYDCLACTPPTKWETEAEYNDHLITFHGTSSADEAMKLEKAKRENTPVTLPPGIPPEAIPTPEFTKMMQEIERPKASQVTPAPVPASVPTPVIEPISLKYKYEGMDSCGNKVTTLELDSEGKHFVVAYCLICQKQVEIREVADLNKKTIVAMVEKGDEIRETNNGMVIIKEKKKKEVKK